MIDTDKYEGHIPGPWDTLVCSTTGKKWVIDGPEDSAWETIALVEGIGENDVGWINMWLMADAPLLLAEVKRLRSIADDLYAYIVSDADISLSIIEEQMDWREEE